MAEHVEARSLNTLNQLAANPPQYPNKPSEERQEPLTLYISRVPGTKDVILSTFRPQLKNVTAEDVASSLYYVHFDTELDQFLVGPPGAQVGSETSSLDSSRVQNQLPRKPLPGQPPAPRRPAEGVQSGGSSAEASPVEPGASQDARFDIKRRPLATASDDPPAPPPYSFHAPIPRKPLGPRPVGSTAPAANPLPSIPSGEVSEPPQPPPALPPRPRAHTENAQSIKADLLLGQNARLSSDLPFSPPKSPQQPPFSLTLIRRDPSTSHQWNIGKVFSHQLEAPPEFTYDRHQHHQPHSPPINVHLETSGYAKFRGMPTLQAGRPSLDTRSTTAPSAISLSSISGGADDAASMAQAEKLGLFSRQVVMTYTPSWTENIRRRFNRPGPQEVSTGEFTFDAESSRYQHKRQQSSTSVDSGGEQNDTIEAQQLVIKPGPGLKPHGYAFMSPWDGRCEFRTGNAGRTLRCRHVLPDYGGGMQNPLIDGKSSTARPISELRFNLPSAELFKSASKPPEGSLSSGKQQLQGHFYKFLDNLSRPHEEGHDTDEEDDKLDLSLGKEKAGGGHRGKSRRWGI